LVSADGTRSQINTASIQGVQRDAVSKEGLKLSMNTESSFDERYEQKLIFDLL